MNGHIVLLGDSIFDNATYVLDGPCVREHIQRKKPSGWKVTLLAVDGATVSSVFNQLDEIPDDATHLVLSAGGNDALWTSGDLFPKSTKDVREALGKLGNIHRKFETDYRRLVDKLSSFQQDLTLCTIYDSVPDLSTAEHVGLCVFNDVISRTAFSAGATLIDFRTICDESTDYSEISPIEPSASGGSKIAQAIIDAVSDQGVARRVIA